MLIFYDTTMYSVFIHHVCIHVCTPYGNDLAQNLHDHRIVASDPKKNGIGVFATFYLLVELIYLAVWAVEE